MRAIVSSLSGIVLASLDIVGGNNSLWAADQAVAYQINPAHDGRIVFEAGFAPPLKRKWIRDLGGPVSYPLIANDMVFVTVFTRRTRTATS